MHKLHHDRAYGKWYHDALVACWMAAENMRGIEKLNREQFNFWTLGYQNIDEVTIGCYNPIHRFSDRIFDVI